MKKTISFMLSLFIFLINTTVGFSADLLKVYFDPYEKSTEEKAIITSSAATEELDLYVAAYKEDKMVSVKKSNLKLEQGINVVETGIDWSDIWKDKVKLFVWDEALRPYDCYEFKVTRPPVSLLSTFVVTANTTIEYNGNTAYRLSGTLDGKESRIIVYNPNGYGEEKPEALSADDVILISKPNGEGVVSYVEKLDTEKIDGVVTQTPMTYVAGATYDPSVVPKAVIGGRTVAVDDKFFVDSYLGKTITAYIADDQLYAISEKTDSNSSFTISASQLVDSGDRYFDEENVIGYIPSLSSSKPECIRLDEDVITYKNYDSVGDVNTTSELLNLPYRGGAIEFISNDADSDIEYILVTAYKDEAVIKTIDVNEDKYTFECYLNSLPEINLTDNNTKVIVYKDGVLSSVENLGEEDTVSRVRIAKNFDVYYVSSENIVGSLEGYDLTDYTITVSGTDFRLSPSFMYNIEYLKEQGGRGIYYINSIGEVVHFEQGEIAR